MHVCGVFGPTVPGSSHPLPNIGQNHLIITAYITAERFLYGVFPLHIKQLITGKRTAISMISIYCITLFCLVPAYLMNTPGWKFYLEKNRSLLAIRSIAAHELSNAIEYFIQAIFGFLALLAVVVLTLLLMITLKKKSNWRKNSKHT